MPIWSNAASLHLLEIESYLLLHSPSTAYAVVDQLVAAAEALDEHLLLGRVVPEFKNPNIRERIVPPYRLLYRINKGHPEIIAIHHSKRPLPNDL